MMSMNYSHFADRSNLAAANCNPVVAWKCSILVNEHVLDANLSLSVNRDAWWWQWCLLDRLSFASSGTYLTICCGRDAFSVWSFCKMVHILLLSLRFFLVTEGSVDVHNTFIMCTRPVTQLGAFAATICSIHGAVQFIKTCAGCESFETDVAVLEKMFLDYVTCSRMSQSKFAVCVSRSFLMVTRLALLQCL